MDTAPGQRVALTMTGLGIAAGVAGLGTLHGGVAGAAEASLLLSGAKSLEELIARLSRTPRRRDFKTVPMILHPK
jgi:citrate synthase